MYVQYEYVELYSTVYIQQYTVHAIEILCVCRR